MINAQFPEKLQFLFQPMRYKVAYGGRGSGKSWAAARALLIQGVQRPLRVLCVREYQSSIAESVHKLLEDQIEALGLSAHYTIEKARIYNPHNGTEFFFEGIKLNAQKIKSYEGADVAWVEEASLVTKTSWNILTPTIRKPGSEIWVTFNPDQESDETSQRFIENPPRNAVVAEINWRDNPWFPIELQAEMDAMKESNYDDYLHIWEGHYRITREGAIYADEMRKAYGEKRIKWVPYERSVSVSTYWDVGRSDATCIWFVQTVAGEHRVLDYYSNRLKDLEHYLGVVQGKQYLYDRHYLPHDAGHKKLGMRFSLEHQARKILKHVTVLPRGGIIEGINAVRRMLPNCHFHQTNCKEGLKALNQYRWNVNDGVLSRMPLHDWASDGADAFRTFAMAYKPQGKSSKESFVEKLRKAVFSPHDSPPTNASPQGWLAH